MELKPVNSMIILLFRKFKTLLYTSLFTKNMVENKHKKTENTIQLNGQNNDLYSVHNRQSSNINTIG